MNAIFAAHRDEFRSLLGADFVCFWRLNYDGSAQPEACVPGDWLTHPFQPPSLPGNFELIKGPACRGRLPMAARRALPADLTSSAMVHASHGESSGFFAFWADSKALPPDIRRLSALVALNWKVVVQVHASYEQTTSASLQLGSLIAALPQGVAVVAPEGRPSRINDQAGRWLGLAPGSTDYVSLAEALSSWVRRAVNNSQISEMVGAMMRCEIGKALNIRLEFQDPTLIVQVTIAPIDNASTEGWVWLMQDATAEHLSALELKRAIAQADQANEAKTAFLATMSHELRTPLNAVLGFSQVLEDSLVEPEHKRQARYIRETGETLNTILNDILDIAKIEAGKFDLDPRPFNMAQVFESCGSIFRVIASERKINFSMTVPPALPRLMGDPIRLRQILQNLLSNAFKFTTSGHVHASLEVVDQPGGVGSGDSIYLRLKVEDSGIGMSADQLQRLFQRFEQADRSTATRFGGTGLGLAIVKALVEMMRGDVSAETSYGQGSTFTVMLPFELAQTTTPSKSTADLSLTDVPLHVLVVDDFQLNRILIRAFLEKRGHTVTEAENGVQAIECVAADMPDLVLMDLDMPVLDGLEATLRLRAMPDGVRQVPIYALTGKAFKEDIAKTIEVGMDGHLSKPVQFPELVRVLKAVSSGLPSRALQL